MILRIFSGLYARLIFSLLVIFSIAIKADALVIYSQRSSDLIDPLIQEFIKETGIKTEVLYVSDGLFSRISAEGSASADVVLTTDLVILADLKDGGFSQPIKGSLADKFISNQFKDKDGYWFGLTSRARIIYASKRLSNNDLPKNLEELAEKKWHNKICIRSGYHPYNITLFSAYASHYGVDALVKYLTALKANLARRPQGNDRAQAKAISQNECDLALGNSYYLGLMKKDKKQAVWFNSINPHFVGFKNGGVHLNISGFAALKSSKNIEDVTKLLNFLLSEKMQKKYSSANFEYPIREDVEPSKEVQSFTSGKTFKRDSFDLEKLKKLRPRVIQIISDLNFDE